MRQNTSGKPLRRKMLQPIRWVGSKTRLTPWLLQHFPPPGSYSCFVDIFGGSAVVTLAMADTPHVVKVYNDIDGEVVNFFRTLRDDELGPKLLHLLQFTPYARKELLDARALKPQTPLERAWKFFVVNAMQVNGRGGFSYSKHKDMAQEFTNKINSLKTVAQKLRAVIIEQLDYREIIHKYDSETTLFYADPPYLKRHCAGNIYRHEMKTVAEHQELAEHFKSCRGYVVLSGYANEYYEEWYERAGWQRFDRKAHVSCRFPPQNNENAPQTLHATESIWLNPKTVAAHEQYNTHDHLLFEVAATNRL